MLIMPTGNFVQNITSVLPLSVRAELPKTSRFVRCASIPETIKPLRKILRSELGRERATRLEGSFGTQKQHYSLARIKARNRKTEMLWIFFGIHTANAACMIGKVEKKIRKAA